MTSVCGVVLIHVGKRAFVAHDDFQTRGQQSCHTKVARQHRDVLLRGLLVNESACSPSVAIFVLDMALAATGRSENEALIDAEKTFKWTVIGAILFGLAALFIIMRTRMG